MHLIPVLQVKAILQRSRWAPGMAPAFFSAAGAPLLGTQRTEGEVKIAKKSPKGSSTGRSSNDNAFHSLFTILGDAHRFAEPQPTVVSSPYWGTTLATAASVPRAFEGTGGPLYSPKGGNQHDDRRHQDNGLL